ncbi:fimbrial protein [Lelliottia nimipressuralis]|uniref:Type 1 fimbrial protein n=1 Tax=Lelliottia nimipressuralis TaxID=69220 RepID=A0ABD4KH66_9ENTR|nr:fimbrial protein [Lelliottia nimipressuralis]MBF4180418.1 type 1 fimbrial protein [Lelliottia nimipressuralis]
MKKKNVFLLAIVATGMMSGLAAMPAMAAGDGTLNFSGSVIDAACTVAPDSKNMTVDFGTVGLAAFTKSAYPYGSNSKTINVNLLDCPATISSAVVKITGKGQSVKNQGTNLATDTGAGAAQGVAVMFATINDSVVIQVNGEGKTYNINEGDNTLKFIAYVTPIDNTANVTAGTITATAQYTIVYP